MAIRKSFDSSATLAATTSLVSDDFDSMGREDLVLLCDCVAGMDDTHPMYDTALHVLRAARSNIRKALREGNSKADMPWAFKGVQCIDVPTGEILGSYPRTTNEDGTPAAGGWFRPNNLREFVAAGKHPVLVWIG